MRTVLNVLNFVLGGFATTLSGFCHAGEHRPDFHASLTRSCWEITKLSFIPTVTKLSTLTS